MIRRKPTTAAGRLRVEQALAARGLLMRQGQVEVPSVLDLGPRPPRVQTLFPVAAWRIP